MEKEFTIERDDGVRERRRFRIIDGKVVYFVVQLEVLVDDGWRAVIRCDNSHSVPDCDRYKLQGDRDKFKLYGMNSDFVFADAQRSLNASWQIYVAQFLRGEYPGWQPPYTSTA